MEEFKVTIEHFEGPLDLMLHLIKEKELDLFDLDVNVLTDQYIGYLNAMEQLHLEVASEYLVELASLIEYKSRKLLPKDQTELDDEYEEDPKERLIRRLLEYQQFKEVSSDLLQRFEERQELMGKPMSSEVEAWSREADMNTPIDGNPNDLIRAMRRVMMRMRMSKPMDVRYTHKEISMEDRQLQIRAQMDRLPATFRFETLLEDIDFEKPEARQMFIATFLAVLDLARQHSLVFTVDDNDVIWFSRGTVTA